ncbi:MAG: hypothetical protein WCJ16_06670 [Actinomycetes bacterium]|jgi:hypothetical protein
MAKVWEIWKADAYEKTTDADARARLTELVKDVRAASGAEVKVMSGWYGEDNAYIVMVQHDSHEAFGKTAGKVFADKTLEARSAERQKNPKIQWKSGGIWVEEDI